MSPLKFLVGVFLLGIATTLLTGQVDGPAGEIGTALLAVVFLAGIFRFMVSNESPAGRGAPDSKRASYFHGRHKRSGARNGLAAALAAVTLGDLIWTAGTDLTVPATGLAVAAVVLLFVAVFAKHGPEMLEGVALAVVLLGVLTEEGGLVQARVFLLMSAGLVGGAVVLQALFGRAAR